MSEVGFTKDQGDNPTCPHCESEDVDKRKYETETGRIGRWNCPECPATFKVTCGTMFHSAKKNSFTKVVRCYSIDSKRQEGAIQLSVGT